MIGHGYSASKSAAHHNYASPDGNLIKHEAADGTYQYTEADIAPLSPKCRYEERKEELAAEADAARKAAKGGVYNDPTFPTVIKMGQAFDFETYNEALVHMENMLKDGVDINSTDKHGMNALHYNYMHDEVTDWLVERGIDVNARGAKGRTALHIACADYKPNIAAVQKLLTFPDIDTNIQDDEGMTALLSTCDLHKKSGVSRISNLRNLLNAGADPGIANAGGNALHHSLWPAMQDAIDNPLEPTILMTILEGDKDMQNVGTSGTMMEHRAEIDGNTPLQRLCAMDSNPDPSFGVPDPVLLVRVADYLCRKKADYRAPDGEGVPPRRRVRSKEMRDFFNDAKRVGVPGSPAPM